MKPLYLSEVKELAGDLSEKPALHEYLKEFCKIDKKKSEELVSALEGLKNLKLKDEFVVKIVDLLPRDAESVNKIFNDVSLDEKEINDILAVVKEY